MTLSRSRTAYSHRDTNANRVTRPLDARWNSALRHARPPICRGGLRSLRTEVERGAPAAEVQARGDTMASAQRARSRGSARKLSTRRSVERTRRSPPRPSPRRAWWTAECAAPIGACRLRPQPHTGPSTHRGRAGGSTSVAPVGTEGASLPANLSGRITAMTRPTLKSGSSGARSRSSTGRRSLTRTETLSAVFRRR
jgi:hypothetical protein